MKGILSLEGTRGGILAAFAFFLVSLPFLGKFRLLGLDESTYALIAKGCAEEGQWFPLVFEGAPFWDKPPFFLWLQGLSLWLLGPTETALRLASLFAASLCIYFTFRLGSLLGGSASTGFLAASFLALQEHFILYSRIGNLDMALTACLLGGWWGIEMALRSSGPSAFRAVRKAGLWFAAGVLVKSWFGWVLLPAAVAVLWGRGDREFPRLKALVHLTAAPSIAQAAWLLSYLWIFGTSFGEWAWGFDLVGRFKNGPWATLAGAGDGYHGWFYGDLAARGLAYLWPLLPLGLWRWMAGIRKGPPERTGAAGLVFFSYYLLFLLGFMSTLINYLLPLVPVAALAFSFLGRDAMEGRTGLAVFLAACLGLFNGWTGSEFGAAVLAGALGLCLLDLLPGVSIRPGMGKRWAWVGLLGLVGVCGWNAQDYLRHPPDPNRVWVAAVSVHPARFKGEPLWFVGEHTDGRALEFYSDYEVRELEALPKERPREAVLFQHGGKAVFLPARGR